MPPDGLIKPGNIDLNPRSAARHVRLETDQGVFLVPAVGDDGKELSRQEAIELFKKTGKHLGQFKTTRAADQYSQALQKQATGGPGGKLKRTLSDYAVSEGKAVREAGSTVGRTLRGYGKAIKDRPIAPVREKDVEIPDVVGEMAKGVIDPVKKAATEAGGELHRAYSQGISPGTLEDVRDSSFHIAQPAPPTLANPANLAHAQQLAAEYDDTGTIVSTTGVRPRVPSYQQGTDYVPETGLAMVHEGEKIVPREENPAATGDPVQGVLNDPQFYGMTLEGRKNFLAQYDPDFGKMTNAGFDQAIERLAPESYAQHARAPKLRAPEVEPTQWQG